MKWTSVPYETQDN